MWICGLWSCGLLYIRRTFGIVNSWNNFESVWSSHSYCSLKCITALHPPPSGSFCSFCLAAAGTFLLKKNDARYVWGSNHQAWDWRVKPCQPATVPKHLNCSSFLSFDALQREWTAVCRTLFWEQEVSQLYIKFQLNSYQGLFHRNKASSFTFNRPGRTVL